MGTIGEGGLGIIDPYIYMGVSQVVTFISNVWQMTPTGLILEIVVDDFALEMGITMTWSADKPEKGLTYAITPSCWIRHMIQFSLEQGIQINSLATNILHVPCTNDQTIMEVVMDYTEIAAFLQSIIQIQIADIMTVDGQQIGPTWMFPWAQQPLRTDYNCPTKYHTSTREWQLQRQWAWHVETTQAEFGLGHGSEWNCTPRSWTKY